MLLHRIQIKKEKEMKKVLSKASLGIVVMLLMLSFAGSAFAASEADEQIIQPRSENVFFSFPVSGTSGRCTGEALKHSTYTPYWVQFNWSSASNNIILNTVMHNSDHASRGQGKVLEGTSASIASTGTAYYYYHGNLWREFEWDPAVSVSGYFSPDNY